MGMTEEEIIAGIETPDDEGQEGTGEQAVPQPQPAIPADWEGRIKKEQTRYESVKKQLESMGATVLEDGTILPPQQQQPVAPQYGYEVPPVEINADLIDPDYKAYIDKSIDAKAALIAQQMVAPLMTQVNTIAEDNFASKTSDWNEIRGDVLGELRKFGIHSLADANIKSPDLVKLTVDAVRGRRSAVNATAEGQRQKLITEAAGVGGAGGNAPAPSSKSKYSAEDKAELARLGMTEQEYEDMTSGPLTIKKSQEKK